MNKSSKVLATLDAANRFFELCRFVSQSRQKIYVTDRSGRAFLTMTPDSKDIIAAVPVTARTFKHNFAKFGGLVKSGVSFRITVRQTGEDIFIRRHAKYTDPVGEIIEVWLKELHRSVLLEQRGLIEGFLAKSARELDELRQEVQRLQKKIRASGSDDLLAASSRVSDRLKNAKVVGDLERFLSDFSLTAMSRAAKPLPATLDSDAEPTSPTASRVVIAAKRPKVIAKKVAKKATKKGAVRRRSII